MSKHDDDEILELAEDFIDEDLDEDFLKSFTPEQSAEITGALSLLGKYKENFPDDVLNALQELAKIAVEDVEEKDEDDEDDEDEDLDGKKKVKKKSPRWSFSFAKVDPDDSDEDDTDLDESEIEELIKEVADGFEILDDLLRTSALLGRELARSQKNPEIEEKIDALNLIIRKIAKAKGVKFGGNGDDIWSFSLIAPSVKEEDDD